MTRPDAPSTIRSPTLLLAGLLAGGLLLATAPSPLFAQGNAPADTAAGEDAPDLSVRPTVFAKVGPGIDVQGDDDVLLVAAAGGGLGVPVSRRVGFRTDVEVLVALEDASFVLTARPAVVLYPGREAPDGVSLRAGAFAWTGLGVIQAGPRVLGPFAGTTVPLGTGAFRLETAAALISGESLLLEIGLGAVF